MRNINSYLSQQVKEARGQESFRQFSVKCGISPTYLIQIEGVSYRGKPISITLETLTKLIRAGVKIDYDKLVAASVPEE